MKIVFNQDTKRFPEMASYADLVALAAKVFDLDMSQQLGHNLKFYYFDTHEDIISVTTQADYEEALSQFGGNKLRMIVASSVEDAQ